jgi:chemotaxis protein MotB
MAKKKKTEEIECETAGGLRWLITYADMITLLLGVFIILVSNSAIVESKYNAMTIAFSRVFSLFSGTQEEGTMPGPVGSPFPEKSGAQIDFPETEMYKKQVSYGYKDFVRKRGKVQVMQTRRGTIFRIPDAPFFREGSAELLPEHLDELSKIGEFLERIPNKIRIEGHTDAKPINTEEFPSNWHLSIARADAVRRFLFSTARKRLKDEEFEAYRKRFAIAGFAQFRPTAEDPFASANRRVDIVVIAPSKIEIKKKILSE